MLLLLCCCHGQIFVAFAPSTLAAAWPLVCCPVTRPAATRGLMLLVCDRHRSRHELTPRAATTVASAIGRIAAASPRPNPANLFRGLFNPRRLRHRVTAACQGGYVESMFISTRRPHLCDVCITSLVYRVYRLVLYTSRLSSYSLTALGSVVLIQ